MTLIPDPANPQAFNRYSYVQNRPINFNDPTGHMQEEDRYTCYGCTDRGDWGLPPVKGKGDDKFTPSTRSDGGTCSVVFIACSPDTNIQTPLLGFSSIHMPTYATTYPTPTHCPYSIQGGCAYPTITPFAYGPINTAAAGVTNYCFGAPDGQVSGGCFAIGGGIVGFVAAGPVGIPPGVAAGELIDAGIVGINFAGSVGESIEYNYQHYTPVATPYLTPSATSLPLTPSSTPTLYFSTPISTSQISTPAPYWITP